MSLTRTLSNRKIEFVFTKIQCMHMPIFLKKRGSIFGQILKQIPRSKKVLKKKYGRGRSWNVTQRALFIKMCHNLGIREWWGGHGMRWCLISSSLCESGQQQHTWFWFRIGQRIPKMCWLRHHDSWVLYTPWKPAILGLQMGISTFPVKMWLFSYAHRPLSPA